MLQKMWKNILLFSILITVCYCQNDNNSNVNINKRRPYYHDPYYHHLLYGGGFIYYLTFILIKIKIVFVLGTIFTIIIFAGKLFALIKYADYMKPKEHHETEKIYVPAPNHDFDHGAVSYSGPMKSLPFGPSYSSGITVDKLPPNAEIAGGSYYDSPPPHVYGRNYGNDHNLYEYYKLFKKIIHKINLTEMAFNTMKLKSNDCKKKFVCRIAYNSKYSFILSTALELFRDEYYDRYKTNATITSLKECNNLYPNCKNIYVT